MQLVFVETYSST